MRCRWCVGFACEVDAKCGTQNTVIPKALETGNCELRTECMAKEVLTNDRGRATGSRVFRFQRPPAGTDRRSRGCFFGSAIESARLLLNSKNRLFPNGLGNRYDWVGRNLQGHTYTGAAGLFERDTYDDLGPGASIAICDYNHGNPGLVGGAMLANEFIRLPYQFARIACRPAVPRWGRGHKDFMRQLLPAQHLGHGPTQEMPVFEAARAGRSQGEGRLGYSRSARLSGDRHPHDSRRSEFLAAKAEAWLKEAGATTTIPFNWIPARRSQRRPAPGRHVPHGQRSSNFCRRHVLPHPRRRQSVRDRWQRPCHERRLQSSPYHHGDRLLRLWQSSESVEGNVWPVLGSTVRGRDDGSQILSFSRRRAPGDRHVGNSVLAWREPLLQLLRRTLLRALPRDLAALSRLARISSSQCAVFRMSRGCPHSRHRLPSEEHSSIGSSSARPGS